MFQSGVREGGGLGEEGEKEREEEREEEEEVVVVVVEEAISLSHFNYVRFHDSFC